MSRHFFPGGQSSPSPATAADVEKSCHSKSDLNWGNGITPNWRERLQCSCGLNNRIRASLYFLAGILPEPTTARIYATEQVTALYAQLKQRYPLSVGSEFLRDATPCGSVNATGLRHEDVTALIFARSSFDVVLSFDVL